MRAALLLSLLCVICGVAAAFGYPAVYAAGEPTFGLKGLTFALAMALVAPSAVPCMAKIRKSCSWRQKRILPSPTRGQGEA